MNLPSLSAAQVNRIIEMAWEDRTPFEAIEFQFGMTEKHVILYDAKRDENTEL